MLENVSTAMMDVTAKMSMTIAISSTPIMALRFLSQDGSFMLFK
jgi:hypothetical protein